MENNNLDEIFVEFIKAKFENFGKVSIVDKGIYFVLYYLLVHKDKDICAGDLAKMLKVSTARIAVLINSLEGKGWVKREHSSQDSRKTIIRITQNGEIEVKEKKEKLYNIFMILLNEIGEQDMRKFIKTLIKINQTIERRVSSKC